MNGPSGLVSAVRDREAELWDRVIEPVVVAWEGVLPDLVLRLPAGIGALGGRGDPSHSHPGGRHRAIEGEVPLDRSRTVGEAEVDGRSVVALSLPGARRGESWKRPAALPTGYHRLRVEARGSVGEAFVISAPRRCWEEPETGAPRERGGRGRRTVDAPWTSRLRALAGRQWGVFAPVYALRSERDWGAGDLADLKALVEWTGEQGGSLVATLPLLAASFGEGADPSPYRPLSRLFWNEFFLAPEGVAEWAECEPARRLWDAAETQRRRDALRAGELVDYRAVMAAQAARARGVGALLLRAGGRSPAAGLRRLPPR